MSELTCYYCHQIFNKLNEEYNNLSDYYCTFCKEQNIGESIHENGRSLLIKYN